MREAKSVHKLLESHWIWNEVGRNTELKPMKGAPLWRSVFALVGAFFVTVNCLSAEKGQAMSGTPSTSVQVVNSKLINERSAAFRERLIGAMDRKLTSGELASLVPFEWKAACLVNPYGLWIQEALSVKFNAPEAIPWINDERAWTLLLVDEGEFTPIRVLRSDIGFRHSSDPPTCIRREGARYQIDLQKRLMSIVGEKSN